MSEKMNRRQLFKAAGGTLAGLVTTSSLAQAQTSEDSDQTLSSDAKSPNALSNPIEQLRPDYDVVIIGSGYGGSILAARLAGGKKVCVLERGKERFAGDFPQTLMDGIKEARLPQTPFGVFDFRFYNEMDILVGSGLGGTSLINANVVIEPDRDLFDDARWPDEIRRDVRSGAFQKYFDAVRAMIQPDRYAQADKLRKVSVLSKSCQDLGHKFENLSLAVNFDKYDGGPNHVGVIQNKCKLCGNCMSGCNFGAKNTLDKNYLPFAKKKGAEIYTQIEVKFVSKDPGGRGYVVNYLYRPLKGHPIPGQILAKNVVFAAGALGSTELLLRSKKESYLALSDRLGLGFSSNGDFTALSYNGDNRTDVTSFSLKKHFGPKKVGATIMAAADLRAGLPLMERTLMEDGTLPMAMLDIFRKTAIFMNKTNSFAQTARMIQDFLFFSSSGAMNHSMVYLGMGHDDSNGKLTLNDVDNIILSWPGVQDQPVFKKHKAQIEAFTKTQNGTYSNPNPRSNGTVGKSLMTVHPLGGCGMGRNASEGVVDHLGRVFDTSTGKFHHGLFVADGSIVPMGIGVNPLLTISALSERIAENAKDFI